MYNTMQCSYFGGYHASYDALHTYITTSSPVLDKHHSMPVKFECNIPNNQCCPLDRRKSNNDSGNCSSFFAHINRASARSCRVEQSRDKIKKKLSHKNNSDIYNVEKIEANVRFSVRDVKNQYIVTFDGYYDEEYRRNIVHASMNDSGISHSFWGFIDRDNPASLYPSDFELIQIESTKAEQVEALCISFANFIFLLLLTITYFLKLRDKSMYGYPR